MAQPSQCSRPELPEAGHCRNHNKQIVMLFLLLASCCFGDPPISLAVPSLPSSWPEHKAAHCNFQSVFSSMCMCACMCAHMHACCLSKHSSRDLLQCSPAPPLSAIQNRLRQGARFVDTLQKFSLTQLFHSIIHALSSRVFPWGRECPAGSGSLVTPHEFLLVSRLREVEHQCTKGHKN